MPTITVSRNSLYRNLGYDSSDLMGESGRQTSTSSSSSNLRKAPSIKEFEDICFDFGIELDDFTPVFAEDGTTIIDYDYKIEVAANRYDLLCLEGMTTALAVFLGFSEFKEISLHTPTSPITMYVDKSVSDIRPFVVGAVLRNIHFTEESLQSFINLQDSLHNNICRKRTLVAIGTHDLDTLTPPFTYKAQKPADLKFIPLKQTKAMNGHELMEFYDHPLRSHIRPYLPIIRDKPLYPIIYDSKYVVLSLPPIINGEHSKMTKSTKNIFIESTATSFIKAKIVLNTLVSMFSRYCAEPFSVEVVNVKYPNGSTESSIADGLYPRLDKEPIIASVNYINSILGLSLSPEQCVELLKKMLVPAKIVQRDMKSVLGQGVAIARQQMCDALQNPTPAEISKIMSAPEICIECFVSASRHDLLAACDIVEDISVAYGFNKIPQRMPPTVTIGIQQPINELREKLRVECVSSGFTEVATLGLCSHQNGFENFLRPDDGKTAVVLKNPKTIEFQIVRINLLHGLLMALQSNQSHPLPLQLFECCDVVYLDPSTDTGARNERHLCAIHAASSDQLEIVHGLFNTVMKRLEVPESEYSLVPEGKVNHLGHPSIFLPGRGAQIMYKNTVIGHLGTLDPSITANFGLRLPVTALEFNIEPFV